MYVCGYCIIVTTEDYECNIMLQLLLDCDVNSDCEDNHYCDRFARKCVTVCPGACGQNTECRAANHINICSCKPGMVTLCSSLSLSPLYRKPSLVPKSNSTVNKIRLFRQPQHLLRFFDSL